MTNKPIETHHNDFTLVYRDDHLLVANKASGLLTVPGRLPENKRSLATLISKQFPNSVIVHRLDQATSGLVVVPQSRAALSHLAKQFQQRSVRKRYQAVVSGLITNDEGEVNQPLLCDWPNRPRQMVHPDGKASLTRYRVLARDEQANITYVTLFPVTGRSHQLRVHMQYLGHAIVGDTLYAQPADAARCSVLMLHAEQITFRHPHSNIEMTVTLPAQNWPKLA